MFQAAVNNISLLPGRRNQDALFVVYGNPPLFIIRAHLVKQGIAALDNPFFGQSVRRLQLFDLLLLMLSRTEHRIKMVEGAGTVSQVKAVHLVPHTYIFDILIDITAFNVVIFKVGHRHHHHVRLKLHHKRYQPFFTDIIRLYLRLFLCNLKNDILRVTCDIMDCQVCVVQQVFDKPFIILIKSAALRVKHKMFIDDGEKPLIVLPFPFCIRVVKAPAFLSPYAAQLFQLLLALFQRLVIHVFFRVNQPVQDIKLDNRKHIACRPVQRYAYGHKPAKVERETYGKSHQSVFIEF